MTHRRRGEPTADYMEPTGDTMKYTADCIEPTGKALSERMFIGLIRNWWGTGPEGLGWNCGVQL